MATRRKYIEWEGRKLTPQQTADLTKLPLSTILARWYAWWTPYEIINTPFKQRSGGTRER